jgi:hypothetical protein
MKLSESCTVQDVVIDWNLRNASPGEVWAITDQSVPTADFFPVQDAMSATDSEFYRGTTEAGLIEHWETYRPSPPADTSGPTAMEVEHAVEGTIEAFPQYRHVVTSKENDLDPAGYMELHVQPDDGYLTSYTAPVELVSELVDRFVNGDEGSDYTCQTLWKVDVQDKRLPQIFSGREEFDGYRDVTVELVRDDIYTWKAMRAQDVGPGDRVFRNELGQDPAEVPGTTDDY